MAVCGEVTMKTMTFDQLIEKIYNAQGSGIILCQSEYNEGLRDAADMIERNRAAIEAGCRGVLRFCKSKLDKPGLYYCQQLDGRFCELIIQPWKTKAEVLECCTSLGLTAVFVEDE